MQNYISNYFLFIYKDYKREKIYINIYNYLYLYLITQTFFTRILLVMEMYL